VNARDSDVFTGTKEDDSSSGGVWAAGFHNVAAHSRLASVFKVMNRLLMFQFFFGTRITETSETEPVDTWAGLYVCSLIVISNTLAIFVAIKPALTRACTRSPEKCVALS
jgi:hypothetical protein